MKRRFPIYPLLFLVMGLAGGVVWLTKNPDSEILERATAWPVVGRWAEELREAYTAPPEPTTPEPTGADPVPRESRPGERQVTVGVETTWREAKPFEWFREGAAVHESAESAAPLLGRLREMRRLALLERDGEWARVPFEGDFGWIRLSPETVLDEPPLGREPAPVVAAAGQPPDPERLEAALGQLGPVRPSARLGPYPLYSDVEDPELLARLNNAASTAEVAYRQRYGLAVRHPPAEAIVLFTAEAGYRQVQHAEDRLRHLDAGGHAGHGLVATYVGDRTAAAVESTLLHELTHLINRRAIGPALPPWLDEGLAEDLAHAAKPASAFERPAPCDVEPIETLLHLDWEHFVEPEHIARRYAQSRNLVAYLTGDAALGRRFRAYLARVADGEPLTPERFRESLGLSWEELDAGFERWCREGSPAEPGDESARRQGKRARRGARAH